MFNFLIFLMTVLRCVTLESGPYKTHKNLPRRRSGVAHLELPVPGEVVAVEAGVELQPLPRHAPGHAPLQPRGGHAPSVPQLRVAQQRAALRRHVVPTVPAAFQPTAACKENVF